MRNQTDELRAEYRELYQWLDELRQQDNHILFELGNPPERDQDRKEILDLMRKVVGRLQTIEALLK